MERIEHTLSIQQMQKLRLLGIDTTDAHWVKLYCDEDGYIISWEYLSKDEQSFKIYDEIEEIAYTLIVDAENGNYDHSYRNSNGVYDLQNIMQLMPELYLSENEDGESILDTVKYSYYKEIFSPTLYLFEGQWICGYFNSVSSDEWICFFENNPLDAAFEMLCWLVENKLWQ